MLVAAGEVDNLLSFDREVDGVDDLEDFQRVVGGYGDLPNAVEGLLDEVVDEREPVGAAVCRDRRQGEPEALLRRGLPFRGDGL